MGRRPGRGGPRSSRVTSLSRRTSAPHMLERPDQGAVATDGRATARAAVRITSATVSGRETMITWDACGSRRPPSRAPRAIAPVTAPGLCPGPPSPEGEGVDLHTGIEEGDVEGALGDASLLADDLVEPLLLDDTTPSVVHVASVTGTGRLSVDRDLVAHGT